VKCSKDGNFTQFYDKLKQFVDRGGDAKIVYEHINREQDIKIYFNSVLKDYNITDAINKTRDKFDIKPGYMIDIKLYIEF